MNSSLPQMNKEQLIKLLRQLPPKERMQLLLRAKNKLLKKKS